MPIPIAVLLSKPSQVSSKSTCKISYHLPEESQANQDFSTCLLENNQDLNKAGKGSEQLQCYTSECVYECVCVFLCRCVYVCVCVCTL